MYYVWTNPGLTLTHGLSATGQVVGWKIKCQLGFITRKRRRVKLQLQNSPTMSTPTSLSVSLPSTNHLHRCDLLYAAIMDMDGYNELVCLMAPHSFTTILDSGTISHIIKDKWYFLDFVQEDCVEYSVCHWSKTKVRMVRCSYAYVSSKYQIQIKISNTPPQTRKGK